MFNSLFAIWLGASLGATMRWLLGSSLNSLMSSIVLGTLVANLLGGYLIGVAMASISYYSNISVEWRLFIITGFLGSLTTFSAFSAEVITMIQEQRLGLAITTISLHVMGSLIMTLLGLYSFNLIKH